MDILSNLTNKSVLLGLITVTLLMYIFSLMTPNLQGTQWLRSLTLFQKNTEDISWISSSEESILNASEHSYIPSNLALNKTNLLFVKTHKCGTSTLLHMFYLYGIRRKLNFVLFPYQHQIQPTVLLHNLVPARPNQTYNIQVQHFYGFQGVHIDAEHRILPKYNTLYTTIVRSPVARYLSSFNYYGQFKAFKRKYGQNLTINEAINHHLDEQSEYRQPIWGMYDPSETLGFNQKFLNNNLGNLQQRIDLFIKELDREFDLVMITSRFDESLVMLKELMGWEMKDIFYLKSLVSRKAPVLLQELSIETKEKILKYQRIDKQIFEHFNKILDKRIDQFGRGKFEAMVADFRAKRDLFSELCYTQNKDNLDCRFLTTDAVVISMILTELQMSDDYKNLTQLAEYNLKIGQGEGLEVLIKEKKEKKRLYKYIQMVKDIQKDYEESLLEQILL